MLVVPIGFVCDHTEILFDIDVQAAAAAREAGVTPAPHPVVEHVADVHSRACGAGRSVVSR